MTGGFQVGVPRSGPDRHAGRAGRQELPHRVRDDRARTDGARGAGARRDRVPAGAFKHAEDAPLLPGRVSIYRDGMFVGRSPMALAAKDETVRLGFGADEKVKVARTVVRRIEGTAGLIGSSKTDEREFKTTIRNAHEFPIRVAIEDQMPVSETEDIQVEMLPVSTQPTARDLRDRRGVHGMGVRSRARRDARDQVRLARALAQGQGGPVRRGLLKAQELRHRVRIEGEQLLRPGQAAERIAPDRDQPLPVVADVGERGGHQERLVDRPAHRSDAARFVDRRPDHGEVETFEAADIAVEHLADMQPEIDVGDWKVIRRPALVQRGDALTRGDGGRQRSARRGSPDRRP